MATNPRPARPGSTPGVRRPTAGWPSTTPSTTPSTALFTTASTASTASTATAATRLRAAGAEPDGGVAVLDAPADETDLEDPYTVVVWDDPVNLMSYVTFVFAKVFPHWGRAKCERKMLEVHHQGKSTVFSGARDEAERIATTLQSFQLWATVQQ